MRKGVRARKAVQSGQSAIYAGFWRRFAAFLLDWLIIGAVSSLLPAASVLVSWLYYAVLESSEKQATAGKMALSMVVTDVNGNRISFVTATVRYFSKILSAIVLGLGFVWIAVDSRKQGWHDKMAGTFVVVRRGQ